MKRGHDGILRTVGGIKVKEEQTQGFLDDIIDRRNNQITRVIKALGHLPTERQIAIICMWMSVDGVDEMLKTLEKST
jgi:hypothetical protein